MDVEPSIEGRSEFIKKRSCRAFLVSIKAFLAHQMDVERQFAGLCSTVLSWDLLSGSSL